MWRHVQSHTVYTTAQYSQSCWRHSNAPVLGTEADKTHPGFAFYRIAARLMSTSPLALHWHGWLRKAQLCWYYVFGLSETDRRLSQWDVVTQRWERTDIYRIKKSQGAKNAVFKHIYHKAETFVGNWQFLSQWRTQDFLGGMGGVFNKFSWGQRTERTGIWGR